MKRVALIIGCLLMSISSFAEEFINLSNDELKIDSLLPYYTYFHHIGKDYADSVYEVTLEYPEFVEMTKEEIRRYKELTNDAPLGEMPEIDQYISVDRRKGNLNVSFCPLVYRDKKYQKLVSFKLLVQGQEKPVSKSRLKTSGSRYAQHSVLSSGTWMKIKVAETGIYQITDGDIRNAGFSDISKIKIYGYGGNVQPEVLTEEYLRTTDDLMEIPAYSIGNRKLFFANGSVSYDTKLSEKRTRNTYSDYGYYFITEGDEPLSLDSASLVNEYYASPNSYHYLYEKDEYSWYDAGRNFFASELLSASKEGKYTIKAPANCTEGNMTIGVTYDVAPLSFEVYVNDEKVLAKSITSGLMSYYKAAEQFYTVKVENLSQENVVRLKVTNGSMRLDYICQQYDKPFLPGSLNSTFPAPEYLSFVDNQDLHADSNYQMVIIIPETQTVLSQANRLKDIHEEKDGIKVKVVSADKLYNEFSSGTPDANAYRRYLKMLYDKAGDDETAMPQSLLLFGPCAWDNRMVINDWKSTDPRSYLLCYESDNSFSETESYVMEDYFGLLDDGEGGKHINGDTPDIGVGRIPTNSADEAEQVVDKIISYMKNENAGDWQNTICMIADDGNNNLHMNDTEEILQILHNNYKGYNFKRVYVDAYNRVTSATGNSYPDVTKLLTEQMQKGALMMNYTGHGNPSQLSHEQIILRKHFEENTTTGLPLWFTASCDIMPFDTKQENHGTTSLLNPNGGSIAFVGTTHTVFSDRNKKINKLFSTYVLQHVDNKLNTIGEALRKAKNELVTTKQDVTANKLNYALLGDPALRLACPSLKVVVDSINGEAVGSSAYKLKAGAIARISAHLEENGTKAEDFNGKATAIIKDSEETIVCNDWDGCGVQFTYTDNTNTVFVATDTIINGNVSFSAIVPLDINYSDENGVITFYAVNSDKTQLANGEFTNYILNGSDDIYNDSIGPNIYCYLNSPSFIDGGNVNATPYFYAEINDEDGINTSSGGIGHGMTLIIDGSMYQTYDLNDYFSYDFGTYTSGTLGYSIPELTPGPHQLLFRAWDILNNSSTVELTFNVLENISAKIYEIWATKNPASSSTQFVLVYDRPGTAVDITFEVFDILGRKIWQKTETNVNTNGTYHMTWNLEDNSHNAVSTGVYLYRAQITCAGATETLKAKKIIVYNSRK